MRRGARPRGRHRLEARQARITRLLADPEFATVTETGKPTLRRYLVRAAAHTVLTAWRVPHATPVIDQPAPPARQVTLLQRKAGKLGRGLGKTTGWIHRAALQMKQVEMLGGVNYERITPQGLVVSYGEQRRDGQLIECDTIVLCAGQEPLRELEAPLRAAGVAVHLIGGALEAGELDAKRAIDQGTRLALTL